MIQDRYRSAPIFMSDRLSVVIGTYFFRHEFRNEKELECRFRKFCEAYRMAIDPLQKPNGNTSGTIIGYHFEFK